MIVRQHCFTVNPGEENRLDKYLAFKMPEHSRSRLQGILREGGVVVNEVVITKTGYMLEAGDAVSISVPEQAPVAIEAEDIPLDVIFENQDLAVINKPAGMVVHPAQGHSSGTLVHAALGSIGNLQGIGGELRPGIVHRLDKDTSGLIVIAKNEPAHRWLQNQFRLRKVEKTYLALLDGKPPTPSGRVEAAIARDTTHRKQMKVVSVGRGRAAVTEYRTITQFHQHTLIEAYPLTGRTHQIRLHMAFVGCPIVGDKVYGRKTPTIDINRHFLHAARLSLLLPDETEPRTFNAPLPIELQDILEKLE